MKRWQKVVLWLLGALVAVALVAVGGFVFWGLTPAQPHAFAQAALQSGGSVTVTEEVDSYIFVPASAEPTTGVIIYPGGHVDARAYAPLARMLAERGYLVAIPRVPLSLAFFRVNAAADIMKAYPDVQSWVIGGHSLGGVAAAQFADANPEKVNGIFFLGSYPAGGTDLSDAPFPASSIRGEFDGLTTEQDVEDSLARLPKDAATVWISGGNHAQFGDYGPQKGDGTATIPPSAQWESAADAIEVLIGKAQTP